jgi:hypothetical protein
MVLRVRNTTCRSTYTLIITHSKTDCKNKFDFWQEKIYIDWLMARPKSANRPNIKQKKAFQLVVEKRRSVSAAMREVGYSPQTAVNPKNLTETIGWKQLMEEYLPDSLLAQKHKELLTIGRKKRKIRHGTTIEEIEEIDTNAVKAGLDMAYKIKGAYKEDNDQKKLNVTISLRDLFKAADEV